jgi:hypothetical protein
VHEIGLPGLDGGNLLGFLAALGTLRVLSLAEPEAGVRMNWVDEQFWQPVVHHSRIASSEELVSMLARRVCGESSISHSWEIGNDLTLFRSEYGRRLRDAVSAATPAQRDDADFLAAFGSDAFGSGPKKELMVDTEFRTMSGAGHQHFLGFMKELAAGTDVAHLTRTLFQQPWDYQDGRPSLRWDPADYRPHALRADDPSGDPIRTMRGANRLAVEALPFFPTVPQARHLQTIAFEDRDKETWITWPIWIDPLSSDAVGSLLASSEIQLGDRFTMIKRGIAQVFRARRFTDGKYRNFTPAKAVL